MKKYILVFILCGFSSGFSQGFGTTVLTDPISSGMGNTFTANISGVYSIGKNPANILLGRRGAIEVATIIPVPNVSASAGTDFFTLSEFNYFFGGVVNDAGERVARYLIPDDKSRLLNLFDDGGLMSGSFSATLFNVVFKVSREFGAIGFSINENASSVFDFPKGVAELALNGNELGKVYDFSGSRIDMAWTRDYTFTYARDFRDVFQGLRNCYVGISLRLIQGFALVHSEHIKSAFETDENSRLITYGDILGYASFAPNFGIKYDFDDSNTNPSSDFSPFPTPAGSGFGIDLGVTTIINDKLTLGFALTGLGSITWDKNVAEYSSDASVIFDDISDEALRDSLFNQLKGEGRFISEINTELPRALRVGASFNVHRLFRENDFPGDLVIAIDYNQGLNNTSMSSTKPRFSIGAEWRPAQVIPIRTGFSFGGRSVFAWSFGTGLDLGVFEFNISAFSFSSWLTPNDAEKLTLSFGSRWKF